MRGLKRLLLPGLFLASGAALLAVAQNAPTTAEAGLFKPTGERVGTATFRPTPAGVEVTVEARGLTPGAHGMHVHAEGDCAPGPDDTGAIVTFGKAKGHLDPNATKNHGAPTDPNTVAHAGDLPNLVADAAGRATLQVTTDKLALSGPNSVLNRALIVHARTDDYATDPSGNSGGRVLCGRIQDATARARDYTLFDPNAFPEGVVYDEARKLLYVTSSAEGTVYSVDPATGENRVVSLGGSPGRQTALGIKLDARGRLWLAGGSTGRVNVIHAADGTPVASLMTPESPQAFVNDLVPAPDGSVYVTDSGRPVLYRVTPRGAGFELRAWLDLSRTPIRYRDGVNLNGIVITPNGRSLVAVQTNTGQLWRIDTRTKAVREIPVAGGSLKNGDGLVLRGTVLYVVKNLDGKVARVDLDPGLTRATVVSEQAGRNLKFPTTAAVVGNDLVVVNGQLDRRRAGLPDLPFELSRMPLF